jgi:tRNA nucleotidyltransferase/poly(A) polymerase
MKETEAARAVLIEVLNALGAMRGEIVIVGGWVPDLLYPKRNHMGSFDVDLAVSPKTLGGNGLFSIA